MMSGTIAGSRQAGIPFAAFRIRAWQYKNTRPNKAATLKTPGNVKRHRRTAETVAEIYNEIYTCN